MPQLPSGRHVALDPAVLCRLIENAMSGQPDALSRMRAIHKPADCLAYMEVIYLTVREGGCSLKLASGSLPIHASMEVERSGLKPADVLQPNIHWSSADKEAFSRYLLGPRAQDYLEKQFGRVSQTLKILK